MSNLSILKEAEKNNMGQFIFSRGFCLYLRKKKMHNTSAATFNNGKYYID